MPLISFDKQGHFLLVVKYFFPLPGLYELRIYQTVNRSKTSLISLSTSE